MKLLNSFGPNPRMVRMFLIEKGVELESVEHDLLGAENRRPPYTDKNPGGQMPALELDDGSVIAETVVMCDYIEAKHPENPMIGATDEEKAETRMWNRRIEQRVTENMYNGFRFAEGLQLFESRMLCKPEAADALKALGQNGLEWLDAQLEGKQWVCGDRFTIADMVVYCCLDFCAGVGQSVPAELKNVNALMERIGARPSAAASLHPAAGEVGMQG